MHPVLLLVDVATLNFYSISGVGTTLNSFFSSSPFARRSQLRSVVSMTSASTLKTKTTCRAADLPIPIAKVRALDPHHAKVPSVSLAKMQLHLALAASPPQAWASSAARSASLYPQLRPMWPWSAVPLAYRMPSRRARRP